MNNGFLVGIFVLGLAVIKPSAAVQTSSLKVCGDGSGWPPYTFKKDGEIQGYDVDVLRAIFSGKNIDVIAELPPWKRCVFKTQSGHYDIALSASYSKQRDRDFLLTDYYYTLQPSYIYSTVKYPDGLNIASADDLNQLRMCGLLGYHYEGFGVNDSQVTKTATSYNQLVQKTKAGRCDVFLARYEILVGFKISKGIDYLADDMSAVAIPSNDVEKFYMMISREHPESEKIKFLLDSHFAEMRKTGKLQALLKDYTEKD